MWKLNWDEMSTTGYSKTTGTTFDYSNVDSIAGTLVVSPYVIQISCGSPHMGYVKRKYKRNSAFSNKM